MASGVVMTTGNAVIHLLSYPIYLHFLGYEKYGVWLVLATILSFSRLGNLGINQAVMKLIAEEHGRGNIEGIQKYITTATAIICVSGTAVLLLILVFKSQIIAVFKLTDENIKVVLWLLPYIGILSIYIFVVQTLNAALSGLGRMDLANYAHTLGRILAVTIASILLYSGRGIESLLIGSFVSYMFIHIMSFYCITRIDDFRFIRTANFDKVYCKRLLRFGGCVVGGSFVSMLLHPFNNFVIARYIGVSTLPIYEIGMRISMQIRGLIDASMRVLLPEVSRLNATPTNETYERIREINRKITWFLLTGGALLYGLLFVTAEPLLKLWLGQRYVDALPCVTRIMLIGGFLTIFGTPAYYTVMAIGRIRHVFVGHALQSCANVLFVFIIVIKSNVYSIDMVAWISSLTMVLGAWYMVLQKKLAMRQYLC